MRILGYRWMLTPCLATCLTAWLALNPGCAAPPTGHPTPDASDQADTAGLTPDQAAQAAAAQAQHQAQAMARSTDPARVQADAQVLWIPSPGSPPPPGSNPRAPGSPSHATDAAPGGLPREAVSENAIDDDSGTPSGSAVSHALAGAEPASAALGQAPPAVLSDRDLFDQLLARIAAADEPAMNRALTAALVSLSRPGGQVDAALLDALDITQREQVARFQGVLEMFRHQLTAGDGRINRTDVAEALDEMFGAAPIEIRRTELCRRVENYGVYETFGGTTFLAGRDHKMIVYTELDQFAAIETGDGQYEVRLDQSLSLYTDWDGQKVWQHEPIELTDRSRNRRRDFYTIQIITLPARLSVGKYRLKLDVTDQHGGSVDGTSIELNIVADQALVKDDRSRIDLIKRLLADDEDQRPLSPRPRPRN